MGVTNKIYNVIIKNKTFEHINKFGFVGCLNTLIDFGVFSILNSVFGLNYVVSQILSYSGGTLNSYFCNKFWTFKDTRANKKTTSEIIQFIVVNAASLSVSILSLSILLKDNSMNSLVAKIISMGSAQVVNFLGYRFWVFGKFTKSVHIAKKPA